MVRVAHRARGRRGPRSSLLGNRSLAPDDPQDGESTPVTDVTATTTAHPLPEQEIALLDAWWRAANYLSVGQIYLLDNPLLRRPLDARGHQAAAARPLGHDPGPQPAVDPPQPADPRAGRRRDLPGRARARRPGGGGQRLAGGHLQRGLPARRRRRGRACSALFRQFSFPGGIPSHVAPETPGSIHEGGELGYVLSHAYGAAMDNPDLLVAAVVGDGEFETGPLATSWHANKFVDPVHDGAVLPILHLNGYKIANPTIPARIPRDELESLLRGYGHEVLTVEGDDPADVHRQLAAALDTRARPDPRDPARRPRGRRPRAAAVADDPAGHPQGLDRPGTRSTACRSRAPGGPTRCRWPAPARTTSTGRMLEEWMRSYRPEELFDDDGRLVPELRALAPAGTRRMSANPHANGGLLRRPLRAAGLPRPRGRRRRRRARRSHEATRVLGQYLVDVVRDNPDNFRIFGPDETASNRLDAVYEVTDKVFAGEILDVDEHLARSGRVVEMLSEHTCQGWLEGYLLTGRHGLFSCYEAFIHLVDSMLNQHAKWLKTTREHRVAPADRLAQLPAHLARVAPGPQRLLPPGPRLHRPRGQQEGRGRPGLPAAGHQHAAVDDAALPGQQHYVNVVVAGKQPSFDWLDAEAADLHCARGLGIWDWASHGGDDPDVVIACAGDVPTLEALAATALLREHLPELKVRFVNVVDLMRLQDDARAPARAVRRATSTRSSPRTGR